MIKLGIIGTGNIFKTQILVLDELNQLYAVESIYDINKGNLETALNIIHSNTSFNNVKSYSSIIDFLNSNIDTVLISTPPKTHYTIAVECLNKRKNVIIEKPATIDLLELKQLYLLAKQNNVLFYVALHAAFGSELEWYLSSKENIINQYLLGDIESIISGFYDPYIVNNQLDKKKCDLLGSYIDSGINELSVISRIIDLSEFNCTKFEKEMNEDNLNISSTSEYCNYKIRATLDTGWNYSIDRKVTIIIYNFNYQIVLDHSNQRVLLQFKKNHFENLTLIRQSNYNLIDDKTVILFDNYSNNRLFRQYKVLFTEIASSIKLENLDEDRMVLIHSLLFK